MNIFNLLTSSSGESTGGGNGGGGARHGFYGRKHCAFAGGGGRILRF